MNDLTRDTFVSLLNEVEQECIQDAYASSDDAYFESADRFREISDAARNGAGSDELGLLVFCLPANLHAEIVLWVPDEVA